MIVREFYETRDDGVNLYRTYSDAGFYIIQTDTNAKYAEAIDIETATHTYTETDELIEPYTDAAMPEPEDMTEEPASGSAGSPADPVTLEEWKAKKLADIDEYDSSTAVNCFYYNGNPMWLDFDLRSRLKNSIDAADAEGRTELTKQYAGMTFTYPIALWRQMFTVVENYAGDCQNVTERHKAEVMALTTVDAVEAYDVTVGYPDNPAF